MRQTWSLLNAESADGTVRAWHSLVGISSVLTDELANKLRSDFAEGVTKAFTSLLRSELGLTPTVPDVEIGMLLEALISGFGFQLGSGVDPDKLEGAYSAAWLSMLSLTQPMS